jgi:hypothetical protein
MDDLLGIHFESWGTGPSFLCFFQSIHSLRLTSFVTYSAFRLKSQHDYSQGKP